MSMKINGEKGPVGAEKVDGGRTAGGVLRAGIGFLNKEKIR